MASAAAEHHQNSLRISFSCSLRESEPETEGRLIAGPRRRGQSSSSSPFLVPTLCVGTCLSTLCVASLQGRKRDAERPKAAFPLQSVGTRGLGAAANLPLSPLSG